VGVLEGAWGYVSWECAWIRERLFLQGLVLLLMAGVEKRKIPNCAVLLVQVYTYHLGP
jgi:hypothetical protein